VSTSNRIQVKVYASSSPEHERFVPVFHRWIRERALDELAIDVADYGHVHQGPGVVLIGHAFDYSWDGGEGRHGLVYTRKRDAPAPELRLTDAVRRALVGCRLLEQDPALGGLAFRTDELLVRLPDRLRAPSDDAGFAAFRAELEPLVAKLYPGAANTLERVGTGRELLGARVKSNGRATVSELLARIS
jgi:hypothetical protein